MSFSPAPLALCCTDLDWQIDLSVSNRGDHDALLRRSVMLYVPIRTRTIVLRVRKCRSNEIALDADVMSVLGRRTDNDDDGKDQDTI